MVFIFIIPLVVIISLLVVCAIRGETVDAAVARIAEKKYSRLIFQIAFTIGLSVGSLWACSELGKSFRDLESGAISSLRVHSLLALAYETMGATGAIIALRVVCLLGPLLSIFGIKEALDEIKAKHSSPAPDNRNNEDNAEH
jgi:hypothetical protein